MTTEQMKTVEMVKKNLTTFQLHTEYVKESAYFKSIISETDSEKIRKKVKESNQVPVTKSVKISELYTDQSAVKVADMIKMSETVQTIEDVSKIGEKEPITVARYQGIDILLDGNHRTILASVYGADSVSVSYIDLDVAKIY